MEGIRLRNIHPGEVLKEEFLDPMEISQYKLAKDIDVNQTAISEIVKGKRGISTLMALKLSKYFGTSAKFWTNLQNDYDIEEEMLSKKKELSKIQRYSTV
jgi:addiction module HigA family antidote